MNEAIVVIINGRRLTNGEVMTLRVATTEFFSYMSETDVLGTDTTGRLMAAGYREASASILKMMGVLP